MATLTNVLPCSLRQSAGLVAATPSFATNPPPSSIPKQKPSNYRHSTHSTNPSSTFTMTQVWRPLLRHQSRPQEVEKIARPDRQHRGSLSTPEPDGNSQKIRQHEQDPRSPPTNSRRHVEKKVKIRQRKTPLLVGEARGRRKSEAVVGEPQQHEIAVGGDRHGQEGAFEHDGKIEIR